jgi:cytochrome bd-type quinol oxidase subunit 2
MPLVRSRGAVQEEPGPRPRLALLSGCIYAVTGALVLAVSMYGATRSREAWELTPRRDLHVAAPIVLYCAALAYGAIRLRSKSKKGEASPWFCAPLILHGLCGLLGAVGLAGKALGTMPHLFDDFGAGAAMVGMFFGWGATMFPFTRASRAAVLMSAGLAGPGALLLAMQLSTGF